MSHDKVEAQAEASYADNVLSTTPPDKEISGLLTPPPTTEQRPNDSEASATQAALRLLLCHQGCELPREDISLKLTLAEFRELERLIEQRPLLKAHLDAKVRLEYSSLSGVFTIRMPSTVHEILSESIGQEVTLQLTRAGEGDGKAAEFARSIENVASSTLNLREFDSDSDSPNEQHPNRSIKVMRKEPDKQFQHCAAAYPGVIIEVAYSEKYKMTEKYARHYIRFSKGDIKAVVGVSLGYGKKKDASISIWRPNFTCYEHDGTTDLDVVCSVHRQEFRDSNGALTNEDSFLEIPLSDFATDEITDAIPTLSQSPRIAISHRKLYEFLCKAEAMRDLRDPEPSAPVRSIKSTKKIRKRKRSSTSVEDLSSDTEAIYERDEREALEKAEAKDQDYHEAIGSDVAAIPRRESTRMAIKRAKSSSS